MKKILGLLMVMGLMVSFGGCGKDTPTGPQGQTLEVKTEEWDNGNIKVEFQYYRDGGSVVKHGYYKEYGEDGNIIIEGEYKEGERWSGELENVVAMRNWEDDSRILYFEETEKEVDDEDRIFRGRFTYSAGKWNGKAVLYYQNGNIRYKANYKDGELNGKFVLYKEGRIMWERCYEMGKRVDCPDDD